MRFFGFIALMLALVMMIVSCGGDGEKNTADSQKNESTEAYSEEKDPESDVGGDSTDASVTPEGTVDSSDSSPVTPEESEATPVTPAESETNPVESESVTETVPETTPETTPVTEKPTETIPEYVEPAPVKYTPRAMMYHLIRDDVYGIYEALFVRPSEFESHLILLNELGYEYLFADEWRLTDRPSVILTLDDGYLDNYTNMFPLLKKYGAKATVFLVTDLIGTDGYMTREMIAEMAASGLVSFQCHTVSHVDLRYVSEDGLHAEFSESIRIIEEITGRPVKALAYPGGGYNSTVIDVASGYFDYAYTTKSPYSVKEYTDYNVPRYYVARGDGRNQFYNNLR